MIVMGLVERGGAVRSTVRDSVTRNDVERVIRKDVRPDSRLMTDTAPHYKKSNFGTEKHEMVNHYANEYVRGEAYANTLEGFFSVFKRGMKGVDQRCKKGTCTGIWRSSISATTTASRLAPMIWLALTMLFVVLFERD